MYLHPAVSVIVYAT